MRSPDGVLHRVLEGRDRSNVFLRTVARDADSVTAARLGTHARPDDPPEPWGDTGVEWPAERATGPSIRLVPADDGSFVDPETGDVYTVWDGQPKAYRYT